MKRSYVHISRYTATLRTAERKGFRLTGNADGSWSLTHAKTNEPVQEASGLSFDHIAAYIRTQPLG